MHRHSRSTVLGLAVLGLALIATPAFAVNLFTVNDTEQYGASGSKAFVPAFLSSQDPDGALGFASATGIYIPYLGTMIPCQALVGELSVADPYNNSAGGCSEWGKASLKAWANGLYYDPRFGTPFIPPSGDRKSVV